MVDGQAVNTFTASQLDAGQVSLVHDGSETTTANISYQVAGVTQTAVNVTVTDVNDNPPVFDETVEPATGLDTNVMLGSAASKGSGVVIYHAAATPDVMGSTVVYSLENATSGTPEIDAVTGEVWFTSEPSAGDVMFTVIATVSHGGVTQTARKSVTVDVAAPPTSSGPAGGSVQGTQTPPVDPGNPTITFAVPRGDRVENGTHIVPVKFNIAAGVVYDAEARVGDGAYDAGVTYSLAAVNGGLGTFDLNEIYKIDSATGRITYKTAPAVGGRDSATTHLFKVVATLFDGTDSSDQTIKLHSGVKEYAYSKSGVPPYEGSDGRDRVESAAEADELKGGKGGDVFVGRAGNDTFHVGDLATNVDAADMITDFRAMGNDLLNLGVGVDEVWWRYTDFRKDGIANDMILYNNAAGLAAGSDGNGGIYVVLRDVGIGFTLTSDIFTGAAGGVTVRAADAVQEVAVDSSSGATGTDGRVDGFTVKWDGSSYGTGSAITNFNLQDGDLIDLDGQSTGQTTTTVYWERKNMDTDGANEVVLYSDAGGSNVLAVIDADFILDAHDFVDAVTINEIV
jgi:hypothetical protein